MKKCRVKLNILLRQKNNNSDDHYGKYLRIEIISDHALPLGKT